MAHHNVPSDVLMDYRNNMNSGFGLFQRQSLDNGDSDCAECFPVAKTETDVEYTVTGHSPKAP